MAAERAHPASLADLRILSQSLAAPAALVEMGGRVVHAAPGHFRVSGLGAFARLGDQVSSVGDQPIRGEIVQIDQSGALVKPLNSDGSVALGDPIFRCAASPIFPTLAWRGRVVNALGVAIDGDGQLPQGPVAIPLTRPPPPPLRRQRIDVAVRTGVRLVDAFTPLCLGQRIGIFAGSGVGKSTLLAMLARASGFDDVVIGLIGERGREVREFIEGPLAARRNETIVVVATGDETAVMRRLAGRTTMALAEWLRDQGRQVLLVMDSVTRFAQAAREIAVDAGEPPVARGFPPSVFSDLPALLERAGPGLEGSGSITALASILVDGDDHNDPIADSIRGILDGHIVLSREIANAGRFPAIDILSSISRLAPLAWTSDQRRLIGTLRQLISRYEETRDIRAIGGYRQGVDPDLDSAVAIVPNLYAALNQTPDQPPCSDPFGDIALALRSARQLPQIADSQQPLVGDPGSMHGA